MSAPLIDYATLRVLWWLILGVLLIGFAVMDGFDLGVGATFRFTGRTDAERRALLAGIEPVWEGNQVWFILGGGASFAAARCGRAPRRPADMASIAGRSDRTRSIRPGRDRTAGDR